MYQPRAGTGSSPPFLESDITALVTDLALKAPLASPVFTGAPAAPTAAAGANTTQLATTAFVTGAIAPITQTTTLTGTQHDFALTPGCRLLLCNNAADLIITGFSAGFDDQEFKILAIGAGNVYLWPQNAGSVAANRLINYCLSAATPLAAGCGTCLYVYDATTARWRLSQHEQGASVAFTPVWTAQTANPVLGNGAISGAYRLHGRFVDYVIRLTIGSTTTLGTGLWLFSLPIPLSGLSPTGAGFVTNSGGSVNNPMITTITAFLHANGDLIGILTATAANVGSAMPASMATGDVLAGGVVNYPVA